MRSGIRNANARTERSEAILNARRESGGGSAATMVCQGWEKKGKGSCRCCMDFVPGKKWERRQKRDDELRGKKKKNRGGRGGAINLNTGGPRGRLLTGTEGHPPCGIRYQAPPDA